MKPEGSLVHYNSMPGFLFLSKINLVQKLISETQRPVREVNHAWPVPKLRMNGFPTSLHVLS
jgi:hypothetical protein